MDKLKRFLLITAAVCMVGITFASIATASTIMRVDFTGWPVYCDPAVGSDFTSSTTIVNVYDSLIYPEPGGEVIPHIATGWDVSDDSLTFTFKLREGVKFHNGGELTAEDVKFSMDRLLTIGEGYAYLFMGKVGSTEVVDKYTVRIKLKETFGPFIYSLIRFYIVSKEEVMANIKPGPYGDFGDYAKEYMLAHDCGSAAYMIKEFPFEEHVLLEKFPDYWGQIAPNAPDEVLILRAPDPVTLKTMFARRELEISDQWQAQEFFDAVAKIEGVKVRGFLSGLTQYLMLHTRKAPTDDIHVRKALSWCLDYDRVTKIFPGSGLEEGPVSPILPGFAEGLFQYHQDFDKAREELRKSKYYGELDQYVITCSVNQSWPASEKLALLLQANAAEIGLSVELMNMTWGKIIEVVGNMEECPNMQIICVSAHYPEAGSVLEAKYHSSNVGTWEQAEWLLSPVFDMLIDDALATADREERFEKYAFLQELAIATVPDVFTIELFDQHAYQAEYVSWPQLDNPLPVMGYNMDFRFMEIFPDRMP